MRRIAMALCALALFCQMLALPLMAAPADSSADDMSSGAASDSTGLKGYKEYQAAMPGDLATESITIDAISGENTTLAVPEEAPEADAPVTEGASDEDESVEDIVPLDLEDESAEDNVVEDEVVEGDEIVEDEPVEDDVVEDEVVEDEVTEDETTGADVPETDASPVIDESAVTVTEEGDALVFQTMGAQVTWMVTVPQSGWYRVGFTYAGVQREGSSADMELGLMINGAYPYKEAQRFVLPRTWVDSGPIRESNGNQFAPEQEENFDYNECAAMRDVNGFVTDDLCIYLEAGEQELTLLSFGEPVQLKTIHLDPPTTLLSYEEQVAAWEEAGIENYSGKELIVEAEQAVSKSDRTVIGLSDNSNPAVQPADAFHQKVNYIGGANWSMPDEEIVWTVTAPKAGLYKVGFHYRQNYLVNAYSYRSMKINGEYQYAEMATIGFEYKNTWKFMESFANGEPILVYLNEGENEISLAVTLGDMSEFSAQMEQLSSDLAEMYRDIVAIISETPDKNTDYDLFIRVPDLEERMEELRDRIAAMIASRREGGKDLDDNAAMLQKMDVVLERMLKKQYEAQNYKSNFYDCYSSLTAQLQDMKNMALDLDVIVLASPDKDFERDEAGFFQKLWFAIQRFIASFMLDYNTSSGTGGDIDLTLWVNWSRDQTLVLNSLINSRFAEQYPNINVTVRMTNASLLQGIMSGNGPDCSLSDSRTTPVNLAMRGALVDLSEFDDYDSLFYEQGEEYDIYGEKSQTKYFAYGADEPYKYNGGVYGLPSTQQFYMMFYRTDIFEQYGLEVPKTWDEFIDVASILMLNNMQVGLPYVALTDIWQTNGGVASLNIFPTLLQQQGLSIYNEDQTGTSFSDPDTMRVFEEWTDFYTKYNLPKEYSFFNRFRVGLVPLAIQTYGQYSALSAAAPEIKGKWAMAEIPGYVVVDEEGNPVLDDNGQIQINNTQAGFGSACMILKDSENKEAAWELLKWWMSTDTQYRYALDIESILGVAGRYTSANVNATLRLDWGKGAEDIIAGQWQKVLELAEIPGGYYVSRAIDQAFWNVLSMGENPKDMMRKWGEVADVEITTKIEQYNKGKGKS